MTRTPNHDHATRGRGPLFRVREERDRQVLLATLNGDRAYAAFALGHLEHGLFEHTRYWTSEGPKGEHAVVMHAAGSIGRMSVLVGDPAAVDATLSLHPGPRRGYLGTCAPEHLAVIQNVYALNGLLTMTRMTVEADRFAAASGSTQRLVRADARELNALYATGGGPTGYRSDHIEQGIYYGVFEDRRLVAVAGTHLVAPGLGIAVVGNVLTRAEWRGRGLATRVTSAVTATLLEQGCWQVTLTVDPKNTPAVRAYSRLGYEQGTPVHDARIRRHDTLGVGAALRRRFAQNNANEWLVRGRALPENNKAP